MHDQFADVRPFNEAETLYAVKQLFTNNEFVEHLHFFHKHTNIEEWVQEVLMCKSGAEFRQAFAHRVFNYFIADSCSNTFSSGIENIDPIKPRLFIGNHRDIVLDSSFLQIYFMKNGYDVTRTAIGDNLIATHLFVQLARISKMFLVLRSGSIREKMQNTQLLSDYIHHSIFAENESVWIAQGNGRAKNGDDKTQQGLLKMLTLADKRNPLETLKKLNITPVAISYQYEPCAKLKARELALSETAPYIKKQGEDVQSIIEGIMGFKGNVNFVIGNPINNTLESINNSLNINDMLSEVAAIIDAQIYKNYYLYPQNYIAYDMQENDLKFSNYYTPDERDAFRNYLSEYSQVEDVTPEKMKQYLLQIYANPVKNKHGL